MVTKKEEKKKPASGSSKVENEKIVAILAYFLVGIIWYFADEKMKKSSLAKHHTKQALNLILISLVVNVILSIIVIVGWILIPLWSLFILILWIIGIINAATEKEKDIPILGQFAGKYLTF